MKAYQVLFGLTLSLSALAAEPDRLRNPGFELNANRDGVPDGWQLGSGRLPEKLSLDKDCKKEGAASFRLDSTQNADTSYWQDLTVEPGAAYRLTGRVHTENVRPEGQALTCATFTVSTPSGQRPLEAAPAHAGTTDWVRETVDFIGPKEGVIRIACVYSYGGGSTGAVWFDGLELVRLAPANGIGALTESPGGCRARAEWALQRDNPDWSALALAIEDFYRNPGTRDGIGIGGYLDTLLQGVQGDRKAQDAAVRLFGRLGLRMPREVLARPEARILLEEARKSKDADLAAQAGAGLVRCVALHGQEELPEAIDLARRTLGYRLGLWRQAIPVLRQDASDLAQAAQPEKALRLYDLLLATASPDAPNRESIEVEQLRLLVTLRRAEPARKAADLLLSPGRSLNDQNRRDALIALARLALDAGSPKDAAKTTDLARQQFAGNIQNLSRFLLDYSRLLHEKQLWAEAAVECQKLVASYPQSLTDCYDAQKLLVDAYIRLDRGEDALRAAKILFAAAPHNPQYVTDAAKQVLVALKAKHGSIGPANAFAAYQKHGPNGPDGKPGTPDDFLDPLAGVKAAFPPETDALFQRTLDKLPKDLSGLRSRGYLYIYWGKPLDALAEFTRRFEQAPVGQQSYSESVDDLLVALRACHGHTLAGERFLDYVRYGPKGKDGKAGTPDDLADPLAELLKPR